MQEPGPGQRRVLRGLRDDEVVEARGDGHRVAAARVLPDADGARLRETGRARVGARQLPRRLAAAEPGLALEAHGGGAGRLEEHGQLRPPGHGLGQGHSPEVGLAGLRHPGEREGDGAGSTQLDTAAVGGAVGLAAQLPALVERGGRVRQGDALPHGDVLHRDAGQRRGCRGARRQLRDRGDSAAHGEAGGRARGLGRPRASRVRLAPALRDDPRRLVGGGGRGGRGGTGRRHEDAGQEDRRHPRCGDHGTSLPARRNGLGRGGVEHRRSFRRVGLRCEACPPEGGLRGRGDSESGGALSEDKNEYSYIYPRSATGREPPSRCPPSGCPPLGGRSGPSWTRPVVA